MKTITVEVTDFEYALQAHRHINVEEVATNKVVNEINRYEQDLSNRLM